MIQILKRVTVAALGLAFAVSTGYLYASYTIYRKKPQILTFTDTDKTCKGCAKKKEPCAPKCAFAKLGKMISMIENAKESVDVCVLLITNGLLVDALIKAHKRGAKVRVIVDGEMSRNKFSQSRRMLENGLSLLKNETSATMHHKFCLIDSNRPGRILLDGSSNWTLQAFTGNFEMVCVMREEQPVSCFASEFDLLWNFFSDSRRNVSQNELLESLANDVDDDSSTDT